MASSEKRYVIVGASAAGMAAAEAIRSLDKRGSVTLFSDEPDPPYFRPLIPFLISGKKSAADMVLSGEGPYSGAGINVRSNARVEGIDTLTQTVRILGGERVAYDRLLIATGSQSYIPPDIEGTDVEGVFALRTLASARAAASRVANTRHAVMLGGGMLNLKAAFALLERGLQVTLVVQSPQVLSQLMEPEDAALIRDAHRSDSLANFVHAFRQQAPPQKILALLPDGADVVIALIEHVHELADLLRRVLQVRIQRHHVIAARVRQTGHHRGMLPEVGMEQHHPGLVRAALKLQAQHRRRPVLAAVVDEHALVGDPELVERGIEPLEQGVEHLFLVVNGDDDAQFGRTDHGLIAQ